MAPPAACPICEDDRQFVRWEGQAWTDQAGLAAEHDLEWRDDLGLTGIGMAPHFAIGQRALLIEEADGCILWDCVSLVTPEAVSMVEAKGGLKAIAISHPHFYAAMVAWSDAFGGVPIHLHADDRDWVMHPTPAIHHWQGDSHRLSDALTLVRLGGHFAGGTVLHDTRDGGALMVGDIAAVARDRRHVSFMRSFPNYIPLGPGAIRAIGTRIAPYRFERIHGGWWGLNIAGDGRAAFDRSITRYLDAIAR